MANSRKRNDSHRTQQDVDPERERINALIEDCIDAYIKARRSYYPNYKMNQNHAKVKSWETLALKLQKEEISPQSFFPMVFDYLGGPVPVNKLLSDELLEVCRTRGTEKDNEVKDRVEMMGKRLKNLLLSGKTIPEIVDQNKVSEYFNEVFLCAIANANGHHDIVEKYKEDAQVFLNKYPGYYYYLKKWLPEDLRP